jgi:hypothetical protein
MIDLLGLPCCSFYLMLLLAPQYTHSHHSTLHILCLIPVNSFVAFIPARFNLVTARNALFLYHASYF